MTARTDADWMRVALGLARRGLGRVWPNPAVGCVLIAQGRVVGRGWTQPGGRPHAEAMALAAAGPRARGATAYVTLEPCAHAGRAGPCAEALIAAGVARIVAPIVDPDPRTDGRGFKALAAAGVEVVAGCLAEEAAVVNAGFLSRVTRGRPRVTLKLATSLDGRLATGAGESRWITGPLARREVHLMRAQADAILVGAGTARSDDPRLDVRDLGLAEVQPVRIVVTGELALSRGGHLGQTAGQAPLWLLHHADASEARRKAWADCGALLIEVPFQEDGMMDMAALFQRLGAQGLTRVLCEGGGRLAAALLAADLVDEVVTYSAGLALGDEGVPAVGPMSIASLALAPRFRLAGQSRVGGDLRAVWLRA